MSIVDPSVLELLNHADSRYTLVVEASKRAREIVSGSTPAINAEGMKPLKVASLFLKGTLLVFQSVDLLVEQFLSAFGSLCCTDLQLFVGMDAQTAVGGRRCRESPLGIIALDDDATRLTDDLRQGADHMFETVGAGVFCDLMDAGGTRLHPSAIACGLQIDLRAAHDDLRGRTLIKDPVGIHIT